MTQTRQIYQNTCWPLLPPCLTLTHNIFCNEVQAPPILINRHTVTIWDKRLNTFWHYISFIITVTPLFRQVRWSLLTDWVSCPLVINGRDIFIFYISMSHLSTTALSLCFILYVIKPYNKKCTCLWKRILSSLHEYKCTSCGFYTAADTYPSVPFQGKLIWKDVHISVRI